jgi:hypothetical protein
MNRSILIVICDFLLLSLLTFSTDINHIADANTQPPTSVEISTNSPAGTGADLAAQMKLALEEEQQSRQQLQQEFAQTRSAATQAQAQATQAQAQLSARERENARLQAQYAAAQTNLEALAQQLQTTAARAQSSQQQLTTQQTEAQREAELATALRQQLDSLSQSNQMAVTEKQKLTSQLQLAEVEQRDAAERADLLQQEARASQSENAKLAESFKMLATNSTQLAKEIHEDQPLTPTGIFSDVVSNTVVVNILGQRTGLFGRIITADKATATVLVTDGKNYFAVCYNRETPVEVWDPGTDWDRLTGTFTGRTAKVPIHSLAFDEQDPRVLLLPVSPAEATQLGSKVYHLSADPYKFQDAVLIGADQNYYGQCNFQLDVGSSQYLVLDRSLVRGLFGKFNPSRGDLVFSRNGDLLGIMVNDTHCLALQHFDAATTFQFNADLHKQTADTLSELGDEVGAMPAQLQ